MKSHAFAQWMNTTLGQALLNQERACVATAMARVFGTRHVEVGVGAQVSVTPRYPGWQQPLVMPGGEGQAEAAGEQTVIARPEELPFHDDMMDSVVLHHTLDLAEDPHQSLREGARVVRSGGQLIVVGFNPFGLWGLRRLLAARCSTPWNSRFLSATRVQDWLGVLDCCSAPPRYGFFRPPVSSSRFLTRMAFLEPVYERGIQIPLGGFYCIVAEKRETGSIPFKPAIADQKVIAMPVANRNMSPDVSRSKLREGKRSSTYTGKPRRS